MTTLLDIRTVAPSDHPDYWSAGIADQFFPMHVESVGSWPLEARLTGREIPGRAVPCHADHLAPGRLPQVAAVRFTWDSTAELARVTTVASRRKPRT